MLYGKILRNRYEILEKLGSGGFSDTYLAKDMDLPGNPLCVVKHLQTRNPSPDILEIAKRLFNQEAEILYRLGKRHDQIPGLLAHFEENGEFYLVQEYIDGYDLTKEIIVGKPISEADTIQLLREVLEVLAVVHDHNVIHRDIKLQNIMRRQDGKIVLIDFGSVKEIKSLAANNQGEVCPTVVIGTPGYIPHEQANGNPRLCSDVYAVGMIGIQALTGIMPRKLPVDSKNGEVIWRNLVDVSDEFANVLDNMVRQNFSLRYQTAKEALQALQWPLPTTIGPIPPSIEKVSKISSPRPSRKVSSGQGMQTLGLLIFMGMGFGFAIFAERLFQFSFRENQPAETTNPPDQGVKNQVKTTPSIPIRNPSKNRFITSPSTPPRKQLNQPTPEAIAPPIRDEIQLDMPIIRQTIMPSPAITKEEIKPSPSPSVNQIKPSPAIVEEKIKPSAIEDNTKPCTPAIENNTDSCTTGVEENSQPPSSEIEDDTKPCTPAIESNTQSCSPANEESMKPSTPAMEDITKASTPATETNNQMMILPSVPALEDKGDELIVPSTPALSGDNNQMVVPSTPVLKGDNNQMVVPSTPIR